jgi:hypothetical protein
LCDRPGNFLVHQSEQMLALRPDNTL